jgi:tRNA (guanine10-N2)-dimethyltransferase
VIEALVELSGEAPDLARAEVEAAAEALGGRALGPSPGPLVAIELPASEAAEALAGRLALARRCYVPVRPDEPLDRAIVDEAADGASAAFRRIGRSVGTSDPSVRAAGTLYREAGGSIDLEAPARRYWLFARAGGPDGLLREVARVDRAEAARRRMPLLPFQRPVSLPPRYARACANLARVRPGDRVVDPFLGTGALLAEAALLGAQVFGIDRDPSMVRGALRNFAHLGVEATRLIEGDAGTVDFGAPGVEFDAVVTDPPYGRSSSTGGEAAEDVVARVLPRWASRVRAGGRLVIVGPAGSPEVGPPWTPRVSATVRVHRSLTREFRAYERAA